MIILSWITPEWIGKKLGLDVAEVYPVAVTPEWIYCRLVLSERYERVLVKIDQTEFNPVYTVLPDEEYYYDFMMYPESY